MKRTYCLLLALVCSLFLFSCSKSDPVVGKAVDSIKLSTKSCEFTYSADSQIITAKGLFWLIYLAEGSLFTYVPQDNWISYPYTVKGGWYEVSRPDGYTLVVKVDKNESGIDRRFTIQLEMGDFFDSITVVQQK